MAEATRGRGEVTIAPGESRPGATVLEALVDNGHAVPPAPCGGRGRCGKCVVTIPDTPPEPSDADTRFLSRRDLAVGDRLACVCPAAGVTRVIVPHQYRKALPKSAVPTFTTPPTVWRRARNEGAYAVAVDIGTTTVAVYLFDTAAGNVVDAAAAINRQTVYGADIVSRITYSEEGAVALGRLSRAIRVQLAAMIETLCAAHGIDTRELGTAAVTGNTTMLHLLAGVSPAGMGRAPFQPAFVALREVRPTDLGLPLVGTVFLLPSQTAYVGADIVSAAVAADMDRSEHTTLLADIGTNGELALGHAGKIYTCATAAGPAFEGASIGAGVGGVAGAIVSWRREGERFAYDTIGDEPVVGICGAGLLDIIATLLVDGVVDETGRIARREDVEAFGDEGARTAWRDRLEGDGTLRIGGHYRLTQHDVREVQLATAAIAAGIDVLCAEVGIAPAAIERVVLTGGFGNHLSVGSAVAIGLLPALPRDRFVTIDNAAGRGAVEVLRREGTLERLVELSATARYIALSGHALFQKRYIEHMIFP